eukprot:TRINITY_DN4934_c0_g1_i1.p1 TRINITY_DN4934_c0_g1~~TRINITY_DN4934_c0_g1_i1.p1  ORF type:complete len:175 (-),score=57.86 TRINITY_DN4934_c0_g1_i1:205-693(-)
MAPTQAPFFVFSLLLCLFVSLSKGQEAKFGQNQTQTQTNQPNVTRVSEPIQFTFTAADLNQKLVKFEYEVFGYVQGVYFRFWTKEIADGLNITGWVKNTAWDTVKGAAEGTTENMERFAFWLCHKGAPKSVIEKCEIKKKNKTKRRKFFDFEMRKTWASGKK